MFKQRGFATLEAILIGVIVVVIAGTGWFVVNSKHKTTTQLSAATQDSATATKAASSPAKSSGKIVAKSQLVFKELSVQMDTPDSSSVLTGMSYTEKDLSDGNGGTDPTAYLTSPTFTADSAKCYGQPATGDSPSFAAISKANGQFDASNSGESSLLKQFTDFYISIGYPNGLTDCTATGVDPQLLQNSANKLQTAFVSAFKSSGALVQ